MSVKIRLQRKGRKKRPFYHIVIADARSPRDGRFIEKIGTYNPLTKPATIEIDRDKAYEWLVNGAQPTDTVRAILRFKGVYYRKHLMRGVKKGAMTMEEAETKYQEWVDKKEEKIAARFAQTAEEQAAFNAMVAGANIVVPKIEEKKKEEVQEVVREAEAGIEETAAEAVVSEETEDTNSELVEQIPDEVVDAAESAAEETTEGDEEEKAD